MIGFGDQTCTGRLGVGRMANLSFVEWAEERGNVHLEHFIALSPADWHDSATVGAAEMRVNELYNAVGGGPNTAAAF